MSRHRQLPHLDLNQVGRATSAERIRFQDHAGLQEDDEDLLDQSDSSSSNGTEAHDHDALSTLSSFTLSSGSLFSGAIL